MEPDDPRRQAGPGQHDDRGGFTRRKILQGVAIGGTVGWVAPTIIESVTLFAAAVSNTHLVFGGVGTAATRNNSGSVTVNYPAGTVTNDLLFLVEANGANQNITTPTGWGSGPIADQLTNTPSQFASPSGPDSRAEKPRFR
jgi:hypothetical protein